MCKKAFKTCLITVLILLSTVVIRAQVEKEMPDNCEIMTLKLDRVLNSWRNNRLENSLLIIIFENSVSERSKYNKSRLERITTYLSSKGIDKKLILSAISQQPSSLAHIKLYVNGVESSVINIKPKGNICTEFEKEVVGNQY